MPPTPAERGWRITLKCKLASRLGRFAKVMLGICNKARRAKTKLDFVLCLVFGVKALFEIEAPYVYVDGTLGYFL